MNAATVTTPSTRKRPYHYDVWFGIDALWIVGLSLWFATIGAIYSMGKDFGQLALRLREVFPFPYYGSNNIAEFASDTLICHYMVSYLWMSLFSVRAIARKARLHGPAISPQQALERSFTSVAPLMLFVVVSTLLHIPLDSAVDGEGSMMFVFIHTFVLAAAAAVSVTLRGGGSAGSICLAWSLGLLIPLSTLTLSSTPGWIVGLFLVLPALYAAIALRAQRPSTGISAAIAST